MLVANLGNKELFHESRLGLSITDGWLMMSCKKTSCCFFASSHPISLTLLAIALASALVPALASSHAAVLASSHAAALAAYHAAALAASIASQAAAHLSQAAAHASEFTKLNSSLLA